MSHEFPADLAARLTEPFEPSEVKWKPAVVKDNRAMALAYIDARCVQDRLDDVLGVVGWQDDYEVLSDGSVVCRLQILVNGAWITKTDVGSKSEQPDEGDQMKAAFSDALKRAAVKFGIGRYLYRLPAQWCDYDPKTRRFAKTPSLPASAVIAKKKPPTPAEEKAVEVLFQDLATCSEQGRASLEKYYKESLSKRQRELCLADRERLQGIFERADEIDREREPVTCQK